MSFVELFVTLVTTVRGLRGNGYPDILLYLYRLSSQITISDDQLSSARNFHGREDVRGVSIVTHATKRP